MNHFCVSMFKHFDKSSTPTKKRYLAFWLNFLYLIFIAFLLSFHQNIDTSWNSECTLYKIVSLVVSNSKKCRKMSTRKLDSANQATLILGQNILIYELKSQFSIFQWKGGWCDEWCLQYSPVLENLHYHPDSYSSLTSTLRDWNFRGKVWILST